MYIDKVELIIICELYDKKCVSAIIYHIVYHVQNLSLYTIETIRTAVQLTVLIVILDISLGIGIGIGNTEFCNIYISISDASGIVNRLLISSV